jgi:hypothetical protein
LSFNNLAEVPAEICNLGEPQLFLSGWSIDKNNSYFLFQLTLYTTS